MITEKDKIIEELLISYEKQYPDRIYNFKRLLGFPYKRYSKCNNKELMKLSNYYEGLVNDMDFLLKLIRELHNGKN